VSPDAPRGRLFAGTSGYAFKEWRGSLFAADLPDSRFLSAYAAVFDTVEINNTFYRFPTDAVLEQWIEQSPPGFVFAVKANRRITHRFRLKGVEEVTRAFVERCQTLGERLGPVLFQCPPVLRRDDHRLDGFLRTLPEGGRYAIEFRNRSWFDTTVLDRLRDAGVALVQSEDDKLETPREPTAGFCYVRLRKDHDADDLSDWRTWIDARREEGRDVYVYLKHDDGGASPEPTIRALGGGR
jgi:uncharacterized protein YecE (DUF72 family)